MQVVQAEGKERSTGLDQEEAASLARVKAALETISETQDEPYPAEQAEEGSEQLLLQQAEQHSAHLMEPGQQTQAEQRAEDAGRQDLAAAAAAEYIIKEEDGFRLASVKQGMGEAEEATQDPEIRILQPGHGQPLVLEQHQQPGASAAATGELPTQGASKMSIEQSGPQQTQNSQEPPGATPFGQDQGAGAPPMLHGEVVTTADQEMPVLDTTEAAEDAGITQRPEGGLVESSDHHQQQQQQLDAGPDQASGSGQGSEAGHAVPQQLEHEQSSSQQAEGVDDAAAVEQAAAAQLADMQAAAQQASAEQALTGSSDGSTSVSSDEGEDEEDPSFT